MNTEIKQVSVFLKTTIKQKEPLIAVCAGICLQGSLSLNSASCNTLTLLSLPWREAEYVSFGDCQAFISCWSNVYFYVYNSEECKSFQIKSLFLLWVILLVTLELFHSLAIQNDMCYLYKFFHMAVCCTSS